MELFSLVGGAILTGEWSYSHWRVELFSLVGGAILTGGWSYSHFGRVGGDILTLVRWVELLIMWVELFSL